MPRGYARSWRTIEARIPEELDIRVPPIREIPVEVIAHVEPPTRQAWYNRLWVDIKTRTRAAWKAMTEKTSAFWNSVRERAVSLFSDNEPE